MNDGLLAIAEAVKALAESNQKIIEQNDRFLAHLQKRDSAWTELHELDLAHRKEFADVDKALYAKMRTIAESVGVEAIAEEMAKTHWRTKTGFAFSFKKDEK